MRGVPGMAGVDGFGAAIGADAAGQAVMLHIIRQVDLELRMGGEGQPEEQARGATDQKGKGEGGGRQQGVAGIGVQARLRAATAQIAFGGEARAESAYRGAGQIAPEAHPPAGGGGVLRCGDMAVMHQAVAGGVMADQHPGIDEDAQTDVAAGRAVDELMRGGVGDLAQPEARGEEEGGFFRKPQTVAGGPGDGERRQCEGDETEKQEKAVGGGEFCAVFGGGVHEGEDLIKQDRQQAHVGKRGPEPRAARSCPQGEKWQWREGCRGKGGHGEGGTGGGFTHHWARIAGARACVTGAGSVAFVAAVGVVERLDGYLGQGEMAGERGASLIPDRRGVRPEG